jgi:hypothetical protein
MVVRKLNSGKEAERIIAALASQMAWHFGIHVDRSESSLSLPGANPDTVRVVLDGISDDWRTHVAVD